MAYLLWSVLEKMNELLFEEEAVRREAAASFALQVANVAEIRATSAAKRRRALRTAVLATA